MSSVDAEGNRTTGWWIFNGKADWQHRGAPHREEATMAVKRGEVQHMGLEPQCRCCYYQFLDTNQRGPGGCSILPNPGWYQGPLSETYGTFTFLWCDYGAPHKYGWTWQVPRWQIQGTAAEHSCPGTEAVPWDEYIQNLRRDGIVDGWKHIAPWRRNCDNVPPPGTSHSHDQGEITLGAESEEDPDDPWKKAKAPESEEDPENPWTEALANAPGGPEESQAGEVDNEAVPPRTSHAPVNPWGAYRRHSAGSDDVPGAQPEGSEAV